MIDNHRFVDAYFVNNEKTVLKTEWLDESGTIIRPYIIEVDKDPDVYKKFMKDEKKTEDWILERTYNRIREQQENYEKELINIAKKNDEYIQVIKSDEVDHKLLLDYIDGKSETTDKEVFALKLKMFERDHVNYSENRGLKAKLRKAKTVSEVMRLYLEF
mgnify:CR=1 FL=1